MKQKNKLKKIKLTKQNFWKGGLVAGVVFLFVIIAATKGFLVAALWVEGPALVLYSLVILVRFVKENLPDEDEEFVLEDYNKKVNDKAKTIKKIPQECIDELDKKIRGKNNHEWN